jgi:WD40 repeat protein
LTNNKVAQEFKGHSDWVLAACHQPTTTGDDKSHFIASGSFDGEGRIWSMADAAIVRQ